MLLEFDRMTKDGIESGGYDMDEAIQIIQMIAEGIIETREAIRAEEEYAEEE